MIKSIELAVPPVFVPFAVELQNNIVPDGKKIDYLSIGAQYTWDDIEFTAEYGDSTSDWVLAQSASFSYLSVAKTFEQITVFAMIGEVDRKQKPEIIDFAAAQAALPSFLFQQLQGLVDSSNQAVLSASFDQTSISMGLRWDISFDWVFKAQFDHDRPSPNGSCLYSIANGDGPIEYKTVINVASISVSTVF